MIGTADERVAQGAELLDEERPGWAARINLSVLDLRDSCRCVLGQVWDDPATRGEPGDNPYFQALDDLYFTAYDAAWHGFHIAHQNAPRTAAEERAAWAELNELWIAEIRKRTARS